MRSKRVARQLKKAFGSDAIEAGVPDAVSWLNECSRHDSRDFLSSFLENFSEFVNQVDEAYHQLSEKVALAEKSLAVSSQELATANQKLFTTNETIDAMINSLGQGFMIFGPDGIIHDIYSKASESLLETRPGGQNVMDVLKVPLEDRHFFSDWILLLFEERIDFEDLVLVGPRTFSHSHGLVVGLEFKPVRDQAGKIVSIVLIATDHTAAFEADRKAQEMYAYATMVVSALKEPDRFKNFIYHTRRFIKDMFALTSKNEMERADVDVVKRHLHTVKGMASTYGLLALKVQIHRIESALPEMLELSQVHQYLKRVIPEVEAAFENKLIEHRDVLGAVDRALVPKREIPIAVLKGFADRLRSVPGLDASLCSDFIEELLCLPLESVFVQYEAVAADIAKRTGKPLPQIQYRGENVRIFPEAYGELWAALAHIFRNIMDHGIERPEQRKVNNKNEQGRIWIDCRLLTFHDARRPEIEIAIHDDGSGINIDALRSRLIRSARADWVHSASENQLINSIFEDGVSTASTVSESSGRGVGLSAVRSSVEKLGGRVWAESVSGKGCSFYLVLPYYTANESSLISRAKAA